MFSAGFKPIHGLNFEKARILIVGDVMLDQYWHGQTSRISPEAPVPIVHIEARDERPGGAANVALGVAALGAKPYLLGLVGEDTEAHNLEALLAKQGIACHLQRLAGAHTIKKLRVLSRGQQMVRLDTETTFVLDEGLRSILFQHYQAALAHTDVVVLSDYGKGTLFEPAAWIMEARARGIPVIVDPKSLCFSDYQGASVVTPNLKEFEAVAGVSETVEQMVEKAEHLLARHALEAMIITRSEQGLSVISNHESVQHLQAIACEVHDVTGAGDTVIAVLSVALATGFRLIDAARLSNVGAGVVVSKLGAATVTVSELEKALINDQHLPLGVMEEDTLMQVLQISRMSGERIVFTNGCFDILHAGHVMYLEQAKQLGHRLIVGVNSDDAVARLKGPTRPINTLADRMHVLAGLRSVDWVVPFSEDTPERLIQVLSPNVLAKGGDYQDIHALAGAQHVLSQGGEVHLLGLKEGCSTTRTIAKMQGSSETTL
ncbi:MAG: bifunctional D-glycero-beta-D-manno-heptose-7-phosphate kinase/D-glycero-beta-D-manno-heptose 1-phosphate adenylyltransferase HldE [Gammaproteobacteria bacterium]|nr:bifunctional D-glycero-beta-D-manno-heptose-7-phosphate kinase/D-glycero-beta-D-manno-heptose 1-phosphate adenylyltransferase HldE [Gammaproteobacteria bacterium]MBP9729413.1 bifunctional D-glycero-beta-D-manno-heptose-7-phosphate kinase/D-glycero-beta-D-manno-heptose 1-phosphate adenylyltransferase HldE [Gammaproteobacteria bacterium]